MLYNIHTLVLIIDITIKHSPSSILHLTLSKSSNIPIYQYVIYIIYIIVIINNNIPISHNVRLSESERSLIHVEHILTLATLY